MPANEKLFSDNLSTHYKQAQLRTASDNLITPVSRLVGSDNLWGRIDAFINIGTISGYTAATILAYRTKLGDFVRYMNSIGITMPEQVQEEHIVSYLALKQQTNGKISIETIFIHIHAWFNWMAKRRIIQYSPCCELKKPIAPKKVIKPLTNEQIQKMFACCTDYFRGVRDKAIIALIYDSGLRRSEVANILLEDIDLNRGAIKVIGKGSKERYIAIGTEARKSIMAYLVLRHDDLPNLFVTQLKDSPSKMAPNSIYQVVKRTMKRAGITGVKTGPHTLRHSFATASIRNGANLFYVQSLLGHTTLNMTRRYAATVDSEEAVKSHKNFSPLDRMKR